MHAVDLLQLTQKLSAFAFLVGTMFATGLTLTIRAVLAPLRNLRLVLLALGLNFILAPAFAWILTVVLSLEQGHARGLLLLGGAAGAPFLPKLVEVARGDAAIAASLMALLTIGTILFMPFALPLMIPGLQADPWSIARPLLLLILLPFAAGMMVKNRADAFAACVAPVFAKIGSAGLLVLFVLLVALNLHLLIRVVGSGAILAAVLYGIGLFAAGWMLGGFNEEARGVLGLGTSARNFGAALVPATGTLSDPNATLMIIVCAIVGLIVSFLEVRWVRQRRPPVSGVTMPSAQS